MTDEARFEVSGVRMLKVIWRRSLPAAALVMAGFIFLPGCYYLQRPRNDLAGSLNPGDQPDKILYEKATNEIRHGRFDVGRLTLQTLINTYPDSEFLSKAKLSIADSYYDEGGVSGLTQAEIEYKDFITFFPTAPEAPEAQFRVGMAHFRMMAKADRDRTEARLAEVELKEFLLKYPDSPLIPRVKRRLRETQEVLARGDYETADLYYMHGSYPAARSRFEEIVEKYPNYSRGDHALWYLGQSLEHLRRPKDAIPYYSQIITDFPLSALVDNAKERLTAMHEPIPRPTKAMLARAQADAMHRRGRSFDPLHILVRTMASSPDYSATLHGPVRLGAPAGGGVEVAKTTPTPSAPTPGGAVIVAQPVNESSLKEGKAVDPKSSSSTTTNASSPESKAQANGSTSKKEDEADIPPRPKKKRFGIFRKLYPF
jgi:outer membrane protein assembly factor BamD